MGHRMEVYVPQTQVDTTIAIARNFGVEARQIGYTEPASSNSLTLTTPSGKQFVY